MAGRLLLRRLLAPSKVQPNRPPISTTVAGLTDTLHTICRFVHSKSQDPVPDNILEVESCFGNSSPTVNTNPKPREPLPRTISKDLSDLKRSSRHDLVMIFTCNVCETRSIKTTCRQSYENGIVVAHCDGCNNLHLIADRLGWFGEPGSVEDLLAARGEEVKKGSAETLNFTLEDLVGSKQCHKLQDGDLTE